MYYRNNPIPIFFDFIFNKIFINLNININKFKIYIMCNFKNLYLNIK